MPYEGRASLATEWADRRRRGPGLEAERNGKAGLVGVMASASREKRRGLRGGAGSGPASAPALRQRPARRRRCPAKPCPASSATQTPHSRLEKPRKRRGGALRGRFRFQLGREAGVVNLGREVTNRERGGSEGPAVGRGQAVLRGTRAGVGTGWQEAES